MFKLIAVLMLATLLQSCEDSNMRGVAHSAIGKAPLATEASKLEGGGSASNESPPTDITNSPSSADANADSATPTVIEPGPAIAPSILAGATLTCIPNASNTKLRCDIRTNNKLVESKPKGIYAILGKEAAWHSLDFEMVDLGIYDATLPPALPVSYMVAISLPEGKYVFDKVGDAVLESENLVKDGSFEGLGATSGFMSVTDVEAVSKSWHLWSGDVDGCQGGKGRMQLEVSPTDASEGTRFIDLRAACYFTGLMGNGKIYQDISVRSKHFYQASFDTKKLAQYPAGNVMFRINREDAFSWPAESPVWATSPLYHFVANVDTISFELEERSAAVAARGSQIDNVRIIDLDLPVQ